MKDFIAQVQRTFIALKQGLEKSQAKVASLEAEKAALTEKAKRMEAVVEAARQVNTRCPEGFDGQDSWTNEAHRIFHDALSALTPPALSEKGKEGKP